MKVQISVPGTFHAFTLGRQLEYRDALHRIFTSYPPSAVNNEGIPSDKIKSAVFPEMVEQIGRKLPLINNSGTFTRMKGITFDRMVSRRIRDIENGIFLGFAGVSLQSLRRANELGLTTVVERSSSHIKTQRQILNEEFKKYQSGTPPISDRHINREEAEYQIADYIVTPSEFARNSFLNRGYEETKVKCVPFSIDCSGEAPDSSTLNIPDEKRYFIFSGTVSLRKGIQYLLPAWDSLDLPNAELIITSEVDDSAKQFVKKYRDRDGIRFVGWVDDLDSWFSKASAFVFPTLEEGSARVVYEAMGSNLPVITTFNSGWVGEDQVHGIEVPIRNSEAIAKAVQYLYHNPEEADRMGNNAHELIESKYTEDNYGERIFSLYNSML